MLRSFRVVATLTPAILALVPFAAARAVPEVVVHQMNHVFAPDRIVIARDTPVRFVNDETIVHHAFVDTPIFAIDSGDIQPGASAVLRFDKEGRFLVRCAIHPKMRIEVEVQP